MLCSLSNALKTSALLKYLLSPRALTKSTSQLERNVRGNLQTALVDFATASEWEWNFVYAEYKIKICVENREANAAAGNIHIHANWLFEQYFV